MKCPICGNRDGGCHMKLKEPEFFCITMRTTFEEYSVSYFDMLVVLLVYLESIPHLIFRLKKHHKYVHVVVIHQYHFGG
jgi:hypothetical protein